MTETVALAFIGLTQICMLAMLRRINSRQGNCGDASCKVAITRTIKKPVVEI